MGRHGLPLPTHPDPFAASGAEVTLRPHQTESFMLHSAETQGETPETICRLIFKAICRPWQNLATVVPLVPCCTCQLSLLNGHP